jgi:hypothetical protein
MYFHIAKHLDMNETERKQLRLAALAQMIVNNDHSYHEIMHVAKTQGELPDYPDDLPIGYTTLAPLTEDNILLAAGSPDFPGDEQVRKAPGGLATTREHIVGKGGILPGGKVTEEIAKIRGIPAGQDSISPNRHPDIASASDLLDVVNRIRDVTGLPTGFKAVIGAYSWLDELFELVNRRGIECAPDFITVDSGDGGTGAAPRSLMDCVGLPIRESLPLVVDLIAKHGLKGRIRVIASGKLVTPSEGAMALCLGADFINSARGFMFALGCIQAMQCNKNTCPTGVTTHDPRLQRGLVVGDKAERVAHYSRNMDHEICVIAHSCGVAEPRKLRRFHCRIVQSNGRSVPLDELFPEVAADRLA